MRVPRLVFGLSLLAVVVTGCSAPDVARPTTTTVPRAAATTTTLRAAAAGSAEAPPTTPPRRPRVREHPPREPRVRRQEVRAHLAAELAKRRPDHPLSQG